MLRLHDSAIGEIVDVVPRRDGEFSMYVCGPTVYEVPHVGHGRFALTWDVLRRWLLFNGVDVTYVSNVTDIDDNIIARASREGRSEAEVAAQFEQSWWDAMATLGVLRPDETPHATAYVDQMVATISTLLDSGHAYKITDGVYLDISKVPGYGLLAGQPLDTLRAGARIERNDEKRSPLDFVLWKAAKPGEPSWDAPFGPGRPGWHTECVVMSLALLGEGFDLHCGGQDLRFPHHENERAQAVALGRDFSRHWVHNGWVEVEGVKMSKSLDNFTTLTDLFSRADPRAYRLLLLRAHYRSPIEVTPASMAGAEAGLERLDQVARRFGLGTIDAHVALRRDAHPSLTAHEAEVAAFSAAIDDDLDTPRAVAMLFELATQANTLDDAGSTEAGASLAALLAILAGALGLALDGSEVELDELATSLAAARDEARARGDFVEADRLRGKLESLGYVVEDTAQGTRIRPR